MATEPHNTATHDLLNELIQTLKDGENGYATALTDVEDADLKGVFKQYAAERDGFLTALEDQAHQLNIPVVERSSVTGTAHRAWINIKAVLTSKDRKAILNECERGEDSAVSTFEKAKDAEVPAALKAIVQQQYTAIKAAHDAIRTLRDASE
jgi:uncharacterized protein (TIGR02284 family)